MKSERQDDGTIAQRASDWFFSLREAGADEQAAFGAWLRESPRHVEEFLLVTAAYRELDSVATQIPLDLEQVRAGLRASVVPLREADPQEPRRKSHPGPREGAARTRFGIAAAALAAALTLGWALYAHFFRDSYSTATGEIRSFELADGSLIQMNTRSRVRVDFSEKARDVQLLSGEALFKVARNPSRPFKVHAGHVVIQAVGTEFNVYRRERDTTVSVLEGAVLLSDAAARQMLTAGQEAVIAFGRDTVKLARPDTAKATAWRERRLVFRGERLEDVAREFNRYNETPRIKVEGALAREKPLAGIFDADDPESLVQFLAGVENLSTERRPDEVIIRDR